ncbi:MAG TPA: IS1595 family transposase [Allosphingosinicella sp.]|nr:IS1595 family transposase [Allosphingosinicella sp.]
MASALSARHFHSAEAAHDYVETRLWPEGPVCPRCGQHDRISKMGGSSTRVGTYKCYKCRKPFTVKIGTIFEDSKVPLNVWLQAMFLIAGSKKGISSNQLHRTLGVTLKTAWFMSHRIREAMRSGDLTPFGSDGGVVEADETFIGNRPGAIRHGTGSSHKYKVLSLVDRNSGASRTYVIDGLGVKDIAPVVEANLSREAFLMTDEWGTYKAIGWNFSGHGVVKHAAGEYVVQGKPHLHTNTVEGYFSIFKRGMRGVYQHCKGKHLHRYLAEFDFRYTNREANGFNDAARADQLLRGVVGRRLTYQQAH